MAPIVHETLVDEGRIFIVGEVACDGVKRVFEEFLVLLLTGGEIEVDEVCRCVVAHGVPVLFEFVGTEAVAVGAECHGVDVASSHGLSTLVKYGTVKLNIFPLSSV